MRTDVSIDRKQVYCPNARALGFGKYKAQTGDLVEYCESEGSEYCESEGSTRIGRIAGRIRLAEDLGGGKPIANQLLVIALSSDLSFVMERWIDPDSITRIIAMNRGSYGEYPDGTEDVGRQAYANKIRALMAFFLSEEFATYSADELRQWCYSGYSSAEQFRDSQQKREVKHA